MLQVIIMEVDFLVSNSFEYKMKGNNKIWYSPNQVSVHDLFSGLVEILHLPQDSKNPKENIL